MNKGRVEAFTDAVIAIIMTILVLEINAPTGTNWSNLWDLRFTFVAYVLSFFVLATTWNNHHHMFQIADKVNGKVLWSNTVMLFIMSLMPFSTSWVGEHITSFVPELWYGLIFWLFNVSYITLTTTLIKANGPDSKIAKALKHDKKIISSIIFSTLALLLCFVWPPLTVICCFIVPFIWLIPNRRIERLFK